MRSCNDFDKYRDGELEAGERSEFEAHLAVCEDCRMKSSLLNNLVYVLKKEEIRPLDLADQIARRAFQKRDAWATLIVSWLRPGPALAALTVILALFSFLWVLPSNQPATRHSSEYEKLLDEADAINLVSVSQAGNDSDFGIWMEQEGNSR